MVGLVLLILVLLYLATRPASNHSQADSSNIEIVVEYSAPRREPLLSGDASIEDILARLAHEMATYLYTSNDTNFIDLRDLVVKVWNRTPSADEDYCSVLNEIIQNGQDGQMGYELLKLVAVSLQRVAYCEVMFGEGQIYARRAQPD